MPDLPEGPEGVGFDPPAPLFAVDADNVVLVEPLFELAKDMKVAIPNPWSETENYVIGVVLGESGKWVIDFGKSLGKVELGLEGWVCQGLARMSAILDGITQDAAEEKRSFTTRLIKRTGKKR